ncbi:NEAT domain-containing protein [Paenibacillus sp. PsM32]|uniref:NEAT domain-containing protein n=1 Tax=Paenibacillus kyungheensis TaxID=1452732 RepID=A0AAX3LZ08_9BACL|nr:MULTISPECIES: NEAT domain-containing protein [Paenibacillus]MDN4620416.1 NEAT domain-containing protein [Paenibacillus sp. PsM32]WCT55144.1 NEAT domain-containing protein [Paenibacillus kyungheensis]WDF51701.1 NEAT domain-containing protein [Paenibacillus sp. KACC 21273]
MNMMINTVEKFSFKKVVMMLMMAALVFAGLSPFSAKSAHAAIPNGTYSIDYVVYADGTTNASYMDSSEYSVKPATLVVTNGVAKVKVTLKHKDWIKSFKTQQNGTYVEATTTTSGDTKTFEFPVSNLSAKVNAQIHVVVPAEIAGVPYDHTYTVQYLFDEDSI